MKYDGVRSVRTPINFSADICEIREQLAMRTKVSLAWAVRDAVEQYVANQKDSRSLNEFR